MVRFVVLYLCYDRSQGSPPTVTYFREAIDRYCGAKPVSLPSLDAYVECLISKTPKGSFGS